MTSSAEAAAFLRDCHEKGTSASQPCESGGSGRSGPAPWPPASDARARPASASDGSPAALTEEPEWSDSPAQVEVSIYNEDQTDEDADADSEDLSPPEDVVTEERDGGDPDYTPGVCDRDGKSMKKIKCGKPESLGAAPTEERQEPIRTKKDHKCPTCGRAFPRKHALQRHLVIHSGRRPFKCFICGRGFTQSGNLKTHMKVHKGELSKWTLEKSSRKESPVTMHVCGECGMDFPEKRLLEEHRGSHKKPHACPECGKAFKVKASLRAHELVHSGAAQFVCPECGKGFVTACLLKNHRLTHSREKSFRCEQCGRAFSQAFNLKLHLRIHSGERPHLCAVCGKSYSRADLLKVHLRVHTGERPYVCDRCGKSFCYFQGYRAHVMIHDKKPKPPTKPLGRPRQRAGEK